MYTLWLQHLNKPITAPHGFACCWPHMQTCVRDTRRSIIPPSPTTSQRCVSLQTYAVRLLPYISMNNLIICWFMHES